MNGIVIVLITFESCWMIFDGLRALIVGDYVTPKSGNYAGQLGPWALIVQRVGIAPRSTLMKTIFVGYGLVALTVTVCFAFNLLWAWWVLIVVLILGLWYLPVGTLLNFISLILLLLNRPV